MSNYVSVSFKCKQYMCVEGSPRENVLRRANRAWVMGYDDLATDLFSEALDSKGCAFQHRQQEQKND